MGQMDTTPDPIKRTETLEPQKIKTIEISHIK